MTRATDIVIIGAGPAGLMAAHAVVEAGHNPYIIAPVKKSKIFGAMFLHRAIPGITPDEPEMKIHVKKRGTREGYADKVYGDPTHPVSWDKFQKGSIPAWSLERAYFKLWAMYSGFIHPGEVKHWETRRLTDNYPLVFCTAPKPILCRGNHEFRGQSIWVIVEQADNTGWYEMEYNGQEIQGWYRYSKINGYHAWEYSGEPGKGELEIQASIKGREVVTGLKPLGNDCDCHPDLWTLGRFGKWQKDVLTHHAYEEATRALQSL
jgi:hypothetical protein